ncbi:MAG: tail fiber domain-containing protein, partial [Minisyncoccota bacterium]
TTPSVSNSDGTLTISPTTGTVVASLNLAHANTWTGLQTFNAGTDMLAGQAYKYSGANVVTALTSLGDYFFGGAGNLTMTGSYNVASGYQSLSADTIGGYNVASGYQSLYANTTGGYNVANGTYALLSNTSGTQNTASGGQSLYSNTTGSYNVAAGFLALYLNTTGNYNTAAGYYAGVKNTTGSNNTFLGYNAGYTDGVVTTPGTLTNATALGYNAQVTASNSLVLGGTGAYGVNVGIGTTSPYATLSVVGTSALGTIVSGTWNGTPLTSPYINFGTGANQVSAATVPTIDTGNYYPSAAANVNATLQDIGQQRSERWSTGLVSGGDISTATGNQINITAGIGYIGTTRVTWGAFSNVAMLYSGDNYVAIGSNGVVNIAATQQNGDNYILLGYVYTTAGNTAIGLVSSLPYYAGNYTSRNNTFVLSSIGAIVESGNLVSATTTPLALIATGGTINANLKEFTTADTTTFTKWYDTADNGWVQDTANNLVNTTQYNVITNNQATALVAMTAGYWKKDLILRTLDGNLHYIYGQAQYSTEQAAKDGALPTTPTAIVNSGGGVYIATVVSTAGDTSVANRIYDVRPNLARVFGFGTSGTTGSVASHSQLSGLLNDDHPQYLLTNGGRLMTGNLQLNSNAITGVTNLTMAGLLQNTLTTEQMRLRYDASDYASFTVGPTGGLTITPSGSATTTISNGLVVGTQLSVGATSQFQVSSTGAVTSVGLNAGSGLIQGTGGLTITGTVSLPNSSITNTNLANSTIGLSDSNSTITVGGSPASLGGALTATLNLAHGNTWTALQQFNGNASTTQLTTTGATYLATTGGNVGIGTTTPGSLLSIGNTGGINFSLATSTFSTTGGINLTNGCFAVNGVCAGTGNGNIGAGTQGQLPFYNAAGTTLTATSSIFLSQSGNVGIGTVSPGQKLEVNGVGQFDSGLIGGTTSFTNVYSYFMANNGPGPWYPTASQGLAIGGNFSNGSRETDFWNTDPLDTGNNPSFSFKQQTGAGSRTDLMNIQANGNVGIGTTSPYAQLSVSALNPTVPLFAVDYGTGTATSSALYVSKSGNVGIGTTGPGAPLQVGTNTAITGRTILIPTYATTAGTDAGLEIGDGGGNYWRFARTSSNTFRMDLSNTLGIMGGNVGIGTTAPGANLDVRGNSGEIRVSTAQGSGANAKFSTVLAGLTNSPYADMQMYAPTGDGSEYLRFNIKNSSGTVYADALTLNRLGNVGIGTTTPNTLLHIYSASVNPTIHLQRAGGSNNPDYIISADESLGALNFGRYGVANDMVLKNGNVGIGTVSPGYTLDVNGVGAFRGGISTPDSVNPLIRIVGNNDGTAIGGISLINDWANGANKGVVAGTTQSGGTAFQVQSAIPMSGGLPSGTAGTALMTVLANGNVGIGTTSPVSKLSVVGESTLAGGLSVGLGYAGTAAPSNGLIIQGNVGIGTTNPLSNLQIKNATNKEIQIGGTAGSFTNSTYFTDLVTFGSAINLTRPSDGAFTSSIFSYETAANAADNLGITSRSDIKFVVGAVADRGMIIKESGNVGIGTTNPLFKLQVAGDVTYPSDVTTGGAQLSLSGATTPTKRINIGYDTSAATTNGFGFIAAGNQGVVWTNLALQPNGGNVGIGTTNPALKLTVAGDIRIGASTGLGCVQNFDGTGLVGTCSSDQRLKTVIGNVGNVLDKFSQLQLVTFKWNATAASVYQDNPVAVNTGFIAQQVQAQFPELVSTDSNGYERLNYTALSLYGLEAIKELYAQTGPLTAVLSVGPDVAAQCVVGETKLRRRRKKQSAGIDGDDDFDEIEIKDIVVGDEIQSLDESAGAIVYSRVNALIDMGEQEVYELVTKSGRVIRTTSNHPFLAREGAAKA